MKFLRKIKDSEILRRNLTYKRNNTQNNRILKETLLQEQKNFCAYTEKYTTSLDACEVEHFNSSLKYEDDYYNYYAVIRRANQYKRDNIYKDAVFFKSLFFQDTKQLKARIQYRDGLYEEVDEKDQEAIQLIDFLGFNHSDLFQERNRHIKRLKQHFKEAKYNNKDIISYFKDHKQELSYITAIEYEFGIELESIL